jgi:DNA-binding XRE family transcriptional regulator
MILTPKELIAKREEFDFTQERMAETLGVHPNNLQKMEYGKTPITQSVSNHAMCLTLLNENMLFKKYLKIIGVDLKEKKDA